VKDDGGGDDTDPSPKTMTIDVTSINDAPTAADNAVTTDEDTTDTLTASDFNFSELVSRSVEPTEDVTNKTETLKDVADENEALEDDADENETLEDGSDETDVQDVVNYTGKGTRSQNIVGSAKVEHLPKLNESILKRSDSDHHIEDNNTGELDSTIRSPSLMIKIQSEAENIDSSETGLDKLDIPTLSREGYGLVRRSLDAVKDEVRSEIQLVKTVVGATMAASVGLSSGFVIWMLKGGSLLASVLSSLPAWRLTDPLAILAGSRNDDDDEESLENIIEGGSGRNEGKKSKSSDIKNL
jgi:hypothetical protein